MCKLCKMHPATNFYIFFPPLIQPQNKGRWMVLQAMLRNSLNYLFIDVNNSIHLEYTYHTLLVIGYQITSIYVSISFLYTPSYFFIAFLFIYFPPFLPPPFRMYLLLYLFTCSPTYFLVSPGTPISPNPSQSLRPY